MHGDLSIPDTLEIDILTVGQCMIEVTLHSVTLSETFNSEQICGKIRDAECSDPAQGAALMLNINHESVAPIL